MPIRMDFICRVKCRCVLPVDFLPSSWNLLTSASTLRMSVIQGLIGSTLLRVNRFLVAFESLSPDLDLGLPNNLES